MHPDEAVDAARDEYSDVIEHLTAAGLSAFCTRAPGTGLAIEVTLDDAQVLHITEAGAPLAAHRADHRSWGVSVYGPQDGHGEQLLAWDAVHDDGGVAVLLPLISGVLLDTMRGPTATP